MADGKRWAEVQGFWACPAVALDVMQAPQAARGLAFDWPVAQGQKSLVN